jgi:hypothetical protein
VTSRCCRSSSKRSAASARQLGHTNAEMVYRRYHKFIPNLRGRDGAHAARWLATEGL